VSAAVPKADAARDTQAPSVDLSTVFGERFNVGGPRGLSRLDIATLVAESCGVEAKIGTRERMNLLLLLCVTCYM
jgi:hypothetical protein